jgi:hypothetical protein
VDKEFDSLSEEQKTVARFMVKVRMEEENKSPAKRWMKFLSIVIGTWAAGAMLLGIVLLISKLIKALMSTLGII